MSILSTWLWTKKAAKLVSQGKMCVGSVKVGTRGFRFCWGDISMSLSQTWVQHRNLSLYPDICYFPVCSSRAVNRLHVCFHCVSSDSKCGSWHPALNLFMYEIMGLKKQESVFIPFVWSFAGNVSNVDVSTCSHVTLLSPFEGPYLVVISCLISASLDITHLCRLLPALMLAINEAIIHLYRTRTQDMIR